MSEGDLDGQGTRVGEYVLERLLGRGGMSRVYFARERLTGRGVAVKILQAGLPPNLAADRRLEQEARAITRIDHPNVVEVYAWGRTGDGLPYIAMEYLEGKTLAHLVSVGRQVSVERMLPIAAQMLSALARAHQLDIIHRDIKPDNVFLVRRDGQEDVVKMLDFGIAKLLGAQPHSLVQTVQGLVLGTPEYLPPELALGQEISPATDIYALGVILFEGLTGRLPFIGQGAGELAEHHCFSPPPRLRPLAPDVPPELEAIVLKCLAKDPTARFASADMLLQALQPFLGGGPRAPTVANSPLGLPQRLEPGDNAAVERALREVVARRWFDEAQLPASLSEDLDELDGLRQRVEALGTELALVEDALVELKDALARRELQLQDQVQLEASLAEELRSLARQDAEEGNALYALDHARDILDGLVAQGAGHQSGVVQGVLVPGRLDRLEAQIASAEAADAITARRRRLGMQYANLTRRRARVSAERAALESELVLERARILTEREQLAARRMALRVDLDDLERAQARSLAQTAVDLAVAVGYR
ncbi:MAG: protein kinase [bacterium]